MNDSYSILIIEDEKNILDFMSRTLKANGYKTTTVTSGKAGLSIINSQCPDLILLDLGLPDMDGNDIIASVREWTSCPIIVISARTGEHDKVAALDLGADDYITKPFGTSELLARIRTSLRHSNRMASNSPLYIRPYKCQGLILDFEKRMLTLDGEEIHLTPVEYKIVAYLARNSGKVMTYASGRCPDHSDGSASYRTGSNESDGKCFCSFRKRQAYRPSYYRKPGYRYLSYHRLWKGY